MNVMKKFFAFVAAALVAFSFSSCEKGASGSAFFKINVTNIEATSAQAEVIPADTTVYYTVAIYYAEDLAKYGADTLALDWVGSRIAPYAEQYGVSTLVQYGLINQGKMAGEINNLSANSDYVIIAMTLNVNGDVVALGKEISYKSFKTKDVPVASEVDLGALQGGGFEDYRDLDGSYVAYATDEATYDVTLNIYDDDFSGDYTEADLETSEYSYIWTADCGSEYGMTIAKAQLKNVPGNGNNANISGWVVASNGIKYKFSFTYPTVESANAPKKAAAKKAELKPLQVVRK